VRVSASRARADEWAVVLTAIDVPCALREEPDGWTVLVAPADAATALDALESYERENAAERTAAAAPAPRALPLTGIYVALLLAAVFALSGARADGRRRGERRLAPGVPLRRRARRTGCGGRPA
jgi:hypothetical protein